MYHLLTGKSPYEPPYQFVPARSLCSKLSHGTEYILNKCVQSEPDQRYQSIDALLQDLNHIYRFDKAYQRYVAIKRGRVAVLCIMLASSIAFIGAGKVMMAQEKDTAYHSLIMQATQLFQTDTTAALNLLVQAQGLYDDRVESYRQYAYALYLSGNYEQCCNYTKDALQKFPNDGTLLLTTASAQYELRDYQAAAENYYRGSTVQELEIDHLRDYAVCLGRMGQLDEATNQLKMLTGRGANPDVTQYVQGEVYYARGDYSLAEESFLKALAETDSDTLIRRGYISLAETYRDGAAQIEDANTKLIALIQKALSVVQLQGNAVLYEMLGAAQYNNQNYAAAAQSFEQVIALGVQKNYLYINAFAAWQAIGDYSAAQSILDKMGQAFPLDYTPHALKATLLIMIENNKAQSLRNYNAAYNEYQIAKSKVTSSDETTQLQQLEGLISQLTSGGWL